MRLSIVPSGLFFHADAFGVFNFKRTSGSSILRVSKFPGQRTAWHVTSQPRARANSIARAIRLWSITRTISGPFTGIAYYSQAISVEIQGSPGETMRVTSTNNAPLNNCRPLLSMRRGGTRKTAVSGDFSFPRPVPWIRTSPPPLLSSKSFTMLDRLKPTRPSRLLIDRRCRAFATHIEVPVYRSRNSPIFRGAQK